MATDRSMLAVRMTNVVPTVTTPSMEVCRRMLRMFRSEMKFGDGTTLGPSLSKAGPR